MDWSTARPDWRERIVEGQSLLPDGMPLFPDKAADALTVFKSLQVKDLPRKADGTWPTLGESCEPFVFELVGAIFGAEDPATGRRLIREFMLLISKKNAKSTIAAGVMVTALIINWRHNAELLILAPTIEVANNSFAPAAGMVKADSSLDSAQGAGGVLKVIEHQRKIKHLVTGAELKVVAADSDTVSGNKASFVLVEELWLFGKKSKSEAMLREAVGGQVARPEGFVFYITTHSDEPPAGAFKSKLEHFRGVRDGEIDDPTSLPMLFEWPEEMIAAEAYLDPALFHVTNPMLGRSVDTAWLQSEFKKVHAGEGEALQVFLAKHLNVEIGLRLRRDRWAGADYWLDCVDDTLTLDTLLARCEVAVVGIDGGGSDDLFGLTVLGREAMTDDWLAWSHAWVHEEALSRRPKIASLLRDFQAEGSLTITKRHNQIRAEAAKLASRVRESGKMPDRWSISFDTFRELSDVTEAFVAEGFREADDDRKVIGHFMDAGSGKGLSAPITVVERRLSDGTLWHSGSELMSWCVSNASVKLMGSHYVMNKAEAGSAKIDPLIALIHAAKSLALGIDPANTISAYESRGLLVI